ncbi:RsmB/NOP family class I SAM-dependent RNA methyltransferase [Candidatus Woesearchaeota archaeon]|nr:RsmB/NOP family class I SAM-dependent RNA methyltransferase [Candidatus Woesearchaeota archaeon]
MPKTNPKTAELEFKKKFIDRYSALTDIDAFKEYSFSYLRKSIRVNTLKMDVKTLLNRISGDWMLTPVPWCTEGFWIEHRGVGEEKRRDVGNLVEHTLGYFYVQEAASMIPPLVLDPQPGERVLDMCAAPGSKTTQIAQYMKNKGVLVANDVTGIRLAALGVNLQRCGVLNTIMTQMHGSRFFELEFDRVLVDAPCSGTGTIRKSLKTIEMWNPRLASHLAKTQRQLIRAGFTVLKPGGTLVYSTCTLEPEEDEGVVDFLLKEFPDAVVEEIKLPGLKRSPAVVEFEGKKYSDEVKKCLRIWPQDNDTEGFFVAKIRKRG